MSYLKTVAAAVRAAKPASVDASQPIAGLSKQEITAAVFADPRLTTPGLRSLAMQSAYQSKGMTADQIVTQTLAVFGPAAFTPRTPSANELALQAAIEARDAVEGGDPLAGSDQPGAATERLKSNWSAALDNAVAARSERFG